MQSNRIRKLVIYVIKEPFQVNKDLELVRNGNRMSFKFKTDNLSNVLFQSDCKFVTRDFFALDYQRPPQKTYKMKV